MKNFSNTKVVLVTTISPTNAQAEMIDYTFLLPGKNDLCKLEFSPSQVRSNYRLKEAPENRFSGASFNVVYPANGKSKKVRGETAVS